MLFSKAKATYLPSSKDKLRMLLNFCRNVTKVPGLPRWLRGKEPACQCKKGDAGSVPGSGRSLGEGNGNPFLCSCLGSPMDRGAWQVRVHGVTVELDMT